MEIALQTETTPQYNPTAIRHRKPEENPMENKVADNAPKLHIVNAVNRSLLIVDEDWW